MEAGAKYVLRVGWNTFVKFKGLHAISSNAGKFRNKTYSVKIYRYLTRKDKDFEEGY
jgi:hypothetical protein